MPTQTAQVTVYRTRSCPFCIAAERLLRQHGIAFEEIYLDGHPDRAAVTSGILAGHYTVPLVVIDGRPVGGFDQLRRLDQTGELRSLVFGE